MTDKPKHVTARLDAMTAALSVMRAKLDALSDAVQSHLDNSPQPQQQPEKGKP
jgi:hypothetical protein